LRHQDIPSIVVDSLADGSPRSPSLSVTNGYDTSGYGVPYSPTPDRRFNTPDISLALDNTPKLQRSSRRTSDISMLPTADLVYASQQTSMVDTDPQHVLSSMQHSMWGDLMSQVAEEEERI